MNISVEWLNCSNAFCMYKPQIQLKHMNLNILVNPWNQLQDSPQPTALSMHCSVVSGCPTASDISDRKILPLTRVVWHGRHNQSVKLQCFWSLTSSSPCGLKQLEPLMRLDSLLPIYPWINSKLHGAIHLPILWPNIGVIICALINFQL